MKLTGPQWIVVALGAGVGIGICLIVLTCAGMWGLGYAFEYRYARAMEAGKASLPVAREFHHLYGERVYDSILHQGSLSTATRWSSNITLGGRYVLNVQQPVSISRSGHRVVASGKPSFLLLEYTRVTEEEGRVSSKHEGLQRHFGAPEWRTVYEANGDFSKIGEDLVLDQPVANFELIDRLYTSSPAPR